MVGDLGASSLQIWPSDFLIPFVNGPFEFSSIMQNLGHCDTPVTESLANSTIVEDSCTTCLGGQHLEGFFTPSVIVPFKFCAIMEKVERCTTTIVCSSANFAMVKDCMFANSAQQSPRTICQWAF